MCQICDQRAKLIYDFKNIFFKSQSILEKYISLNNIIIPEEIFLLNCEDVVGHIPEDFENKQIQKVTNRSTNSLKVELLNDNEFMIKKGSLKPLPKCRYCHKRFPTLGLVKKHTLNCKSTETFKCDYCTFSFPSLTSRKRHVKLKHIKETGLDVPHYECDICKQKFPSTSARTYHKVTRHNTSGKLYACEICHKTFVIKSSLNQHKEVHNKGQSKVVCPICGKSFHYKGM